MNFHSIFFVLLGMGAITACSRLAPLLLPAHWLKHPRIGVLNRLLPASVMMILLLSALDSSTSPSPWLRDVLCLLPVLGSYYRWRQPLISIVLGVGCAAIWTHLLN